MEALLYNENWKNIGNFPLDGKIFEKSVNSELIWRFLRLQLSNWRIAISHTKTRWERRWSTRKIYKQKWTGRARMGSNRSPIRKKWW